MSVISASVPSRHPAAPRPVPIGIRLVAAALRIGPPDQAQWERIGADLTAGDPAMARLVETMSGADGVAQKELFEAVARDGLTHTADVPEPMREFFATAETPPEWVDFARVRRGQRSLRRGGTDGTYIARDVSFLGGYQFSSFNQTLLRTGVMTKGSNKRFAETLQWALDVTDDGGLEPGGVGYRSTLRVRMIHEFVRRYVAHRADWRADDWGLPINQTDMAATLVGALIAPATGALAMGVVLSPRELDDIAHTTRYVGWLMGVDDYWLPRSFRDAVRILHHTLGALSAPDETTRQLVEPMAADPLDWHLPAPTGLRRRIARALHLSITATYLGPRTMRDLGLPALVLPWYPALRIPVNLTRSAAALLLPGGLERAGERGRAEQLRFLRQMVGTDDASVGSSAQVAHAD